MANPASTKPSAKEPPLPMRHDQFFKESFSNLERAREFFQRTLPPPIVKTAKWETLRLLPKSFVNARLANSEADLLYLVDLSESGDKGESHEDNAKIKTKAKPGLPLCLCVLFEHQSTLDWDMPFRLLKYIVSVWDAQERQEKKKRQRAKPSGNGQRTESKRGFFPVLPVIFHQEKEKWTAPRGVWEWLCTKNRGLRRLKFLRRWVPDFRHIVLEVGQMEELAQSSPVFLGVVLSLMKAVPEGRTAAWWDEWEERIRQALNEAPEALRLLESIINYIISTTPEEEHSTMEKKVARLEEEQLKGIDMRTMADVYIEQGIEKGKIKGKLMGTIRTLQMVMNEEQTAEVELEKLDVEELEKLVGKLTSKLNG